MQTSAPGRWRAPRGSFPLRVKGGCGRQANGTAGLPPAPEMPVRSGTYASCQQPTFRQSVANGFPTERHRRERYGRSTAVLI
jgi:hypothetical protein